MPGYTRQDTGDNISNGTTSDADVLDAEFNAIEAAFNSSTGHRHDGTSAGGAAVLTLGAAQEVSVSGAAFLPKTDNTYDLGSSIKGWKNFNVKGVSTLASLIATTADINGGTIDNVTIGGNVRGTIYASFLDVNGDIEANTVTANLVGNSTGSHTGAVTSSNAVITGGSVNGTPIGATTASTIRGTTVTATGSFVGNLTGNSTGSHTGSVTGDVVGSISGGSVTTSAANITGGSVTGITDLAVADGGTGASTAAGALVNLGLTATAAEINKLDGVTASTAEINFIDGVTSNIQTQLDAKQPLDSDLTAIAALATAGFLSRAGAGNINTRTITGSGLVGVSNGAGAAADPVIDVPIASQAQAEAGVNTTTGMTPERTNQAIAALMTTTQTLANTGRANFASGLQLRWGVITSTIDADENFTFTYPFTNACYAVVSTISGTHFNKSTTGFTINRSDSIDGNEVGYYIAIGS